MTTVTVTIDDKKAKILKKSTIRFKMQPKVLLLAPKNNLVTQENSDIKWVVMHSLEKNHELYNLVVVKLTEQETLEGPTIDNHSGNDAFTFPWYKLKRDNHGSV